MTDGHTGVHGRVLENLLDGVMVIERAGTITMFNAAAGRILGIAPDEAVDRGRSYWVGVIDPATREVNERGVVIGPTTQDSVEVVAGLAPGDEILIRDR